MMFLILIITIVLPLALRDGNASSQWANELRRLKIQKLQQSRALNILKDHRHVIESLSANVQTVDSITLSLIEATRQKAREEQLELTQLSVIQSDNAQPIISENTANVHALTVKFAVKMGRAMRLLPMFDALREVAGWRPIEIRGCSVVKRSESVHNLHATCSVDVYFFPEIDK